jgi:NADH:ubiquinone reductase (H+-translocating)
MNQHIVIVGGGFAGLNAANRLKNAPVDITLIDRRNHHLFQPLLYQVATGVLSPADIATPLRTLLRHQKNVRVLLGEVVDFDTANQQVVLSDGVVGYDTLIIAAGAGSHYFGNDQWQHHAPSLKSIEDATEIRRRILTAFEAAEKATDPEEVRAWLTFVVIGGGPTGVELAGALAEIAHDTLRHKFRNIDPTAASIQLIQSGERVLPMYHPTLSAQAAEALTRLGVEVRTGMRVTDVQTGGVTVAYDDTQTFIPAQTVLWTAGVKASSLGRKLADATGTELDRGGRVIVEPDLSVPGHPEIFVVGDLANYSHQTGTPLPGVAQVAIQEGRYVGQVIQQRLQGRSVPAFHYQDRGNMATIGRGAAIAEIGKLRLSGWVAWPMWLLIHLMYQADVENRVLVLVQWLWNFVTRNRSALLITERPSAADTTVSRPRSQLAYETGTFNRVK